jgi:hypothetical protein
MGMTDQERKQEVEYLLEVQFRTQRELERAFRSYIEAGEAILAEAEGNGDRRRLANLQRKYEQAHKATMDLVHESVYYINSLGEVLSAWDAARPGRDYVDYVEKAYGLAELYANAFREMGATSRKVRFAVDAIIAARDSGLP